MRSSVQASSWHLSDSCLSHQNICTRCFRLKLLEGRFLRDTLGLQTVVPNQSSSVRTRAEPFTQRTSHDQKEHEEGTALSNKKLTQEKVMIYSVRVHEFGVNG